jgi:mannose-6-phosphate isomerase-like protein (cupin superfamily)
MPSLEHDKRPWGEYQVLLDSPFCKVKIITVKPGGQLSYQSHEHRSETWTVVQGMAGYTLDGSDNVLTPKNTVYIPQGAKHRLENKHDSILKIIEIQTGTYFGEDDITRYDDDFGRI